MITVKMSDEMWEGAQREADKQTRAWEGQERMVVSKPEAIEKMKLVSMAGELAVYWLLNNQGLRVTRFNLDQPADLVVWQDGKPVYLDVKTGTEDYHRKCLIDGLQWDAQKDIVNYVVGAKISARNIEVWGLAKHSEFALDRSLVRRGYTMWLNDMKPIEDTFEDFDKHEVSDN